MKRVFILLSFLLFLCVAGVPKIYGQTPAHYATCDVCGFCVNSQSTADWATIKVPGGWKSCATCMYEDLNPTNALDGTTLAINEQTNLPPPPKQGSYYTVFGCIKTDLTDFTQTGAASSLVQMLLKLIFMTAGGIALLYIIYGAYLIMTSQADPERLRYGKKVVTGSIIGLILVLSSVFIVNILASGVLRLPGFGR